MLEIVSSKKVAPRRSEDARAEARGSAREQDIEAFGRALEALKAEVEATLGEEDAQHILRIGKLSKRMEIAGRTLLQLSFDPFTFSFGVGALFVHKALELMEIGHPALHGCYDGLPGCEKYGSATFQWVAPVDEPSWKKVHNVLHHRYTNIEGKDPDINFGMLRLSARVPYRYVHVLQPLSNLFTTFGFGTALQLHVTGMLDIYLQNGELQVLRDRSPATIKKQNRLFLRKMRKHFTREYLFFPLLAGPFAGKVLLGNVLSEVLRDMWAAAIIYCGHVGTRDYPAGTVAATRAHWYAMQVEAGRDCDVPEWISILCGALDKQIEHHLFPRLPPNRLREIAPRVRAICAEHGVEHRSERWPSALASVLRELTRLASPKAAADQVSASSALAAE